MLLLPVLAHVLLTGWWRLLLQILHEFYPLIAELILMAKLEESEELNSNLCVVSFQTACSWSGSWLIVCALPLAGLSSSTTASHARCVLSCCFLALPDLVGWRCVPEQILLYYLVSCVVKKDVPRVAQLVRCAACLPTPRLPSS